MKVCILTLGCKINYYESGQLTQMYRDRGYEIVTKFIPDADEYVVNTCAVTSHAQKKSRNTVTRVKKVAGDKPVIVCGCAGDREVNKKLDCHAVQTRQRAFIKVQDGCNNFCSYCVVPYLRGRSTSRIAQDIVAEVQKNHKPVVISGIDLSSYGLDIGTDLKTLCIEIDKCGYPFELSSLEVRILTPEFLTTLKSCKNFIPKFHIPLQSGSNKVLRDMNRKYTREEYMGAIDRVREFFPNATIATDVIIGFPTETPADLADTHDIIARAKFTHVHTFPYSDRNLAQYKNKKI